VIVTAVAAKTKNKSMTTSETIDKSIKLPPAEDYNFLRREGIKHIEKMAGDVWTDYNAHDPGITLLENLCYAITDLAYRTNFDIKDLLSKNNSEQNKWRNIFYTAREILPCNPITINDYRKLVMDVDGVRNAWITTSKDCEVPVFLRKPDAKLFNEILKQQQEKDKHHCCQSSIHLPYTFKDVQYGLNYSGDKIIELNGLYKIIVEYEEEVIEKKQENEVRKHIVKVLHRHRNVCEDFLSVTGAEYKDFFLQSKIQISESADADLILAQICYGIQNYFTPVLKFYSLNEMIESGMQTDEIFEGPALKHGFIKDEELEKTDMFRDMRLSDIINFISDIEGIRALQVFKVIVTPNDDTVKADEKDHCANEAFFDDWIGRMQKEKLVGRLSIDDMLRYFHPSEDDLVTPVSDIHFFKPSGEVVINTDRFQKLLNDLKGKDKYMKMSGFQNNFPVPVGENMELDNFYPVQYQLPFVYRVGESGLPLREGSKRLIQSLQLKGYLAVFEQLFLNYLYLLDNMNEIFSFGDVKFKGLSHHLQFKSACEPVDMQQEDAASGNEKVATHLNQIIYKDDTGEIIEKIAGYKCLYYDAEKYINNLQSIIETETDFEWNRNQMLDHLLARFNEQMNEYVSLMQYMYPDDYLLKVMKSKSDILSDYPAISNYRSKAYNYKLEEEEWNYENATWDEDRIALNISGLEKRIARLIGLSTYLRRDLSPDNLFLEKVTTAEGVMVKVVLYEDETKERVLLESRLVGAKCCDEIMHAFIDSGCCQQNFYPYPEQQAPHRRAHHHQHHAEYSFALKDKSGREIARSPVYNSQKSRDEAMRLAKCFLEKICANDGFHMIEHILLRPKGDTQLTDENDNPYGEEFKLLDVCLDKCDLLIKQDATATVDYKFDLQVLPAEECLDGKRWKVILNRIRPSVGGNPVKILEHTFKDFELASDFISNMREYGSELVNYAIYKTKVGDKFYFKLKDKNGNTIVESSCFSTYSSKAVEEKAIPGKRTQCDTTITDRGILDEMEKLKEFLAYELDLYCCEEPCDHNEDPYSFRVTFVLPCWPKRFRNNGFRKFVEKVIRSETPAHIQANIFWLGITEMRNYEEAYFDWLVEMAANDTPDIAVCNNLITQVINLKNCDEECDDKESIYTGKIHVR
jgi:uncharacterized protein YegP (UPF0339 family)